MAKLVLPRVHALVVCDEIEPSQSEDDVFDFRGVRTTIRADEYPYIHPQLCIYVLATGHEGTARCQVAVLGADDVTAAISAERAIDFHGPLAFVPIIDHLNDCDFPSAGIYYVQVSFDGKLLGERALFLFSNGEAVGNNGR